MNEINYTEFTIKGIGRQIAYFKETLRGQGSNSHSSTFSLLPSQSFPPNCGCGFVQVRVSFFIPFKLTPHVSPSRVRQLPLLHLLYFPLTYRKIRDKK